MSLSISRYTMHKTPQRASHTFVGQQEAAELVRWLNDSARAEDRRDSLARKHITQLVRDLNKNAEFFIRQGKADTALAEKIDHELSRYPLRVKTVHVQDVGKYKTFAEPKWIFGWFSSAGTRVAEMIFGIVRLGERGLLGRVRTCSRCQRWFYAKFNHQRFCGKNCQTLHYQTSEEWKRRRRERYQNRSL